MLTNRRQFLVGAAGMGALLQAPDVLAAPQEEQAGDSHGVLIDTTKCVGCRRCEAACQRAQGFDPLPDEALDDPAVFETRRRPDVRAYTVVNRTATESGEAFVKQNCMHCVTPACVSACLVSALQKRSDGPVTYDASRCMGCRYCMVACPFEIPAYDYSNPVTPQVRKCNLCAHEVPGVHEAPACVRVCPEEALVYGPREDLLREARARIKEAPDRYTDRIYGEHEAGGTSILYLSALPFAALGFWDLPDEPPSALTERIQHAIFKKFGPPMMLYGLLGAAMWVSRPHLSLARNGRAK